jgi:hypothetical protein
MDKDQATGRPQQHLWIISVFLGMPLLIINRKINMCLCNEGEINDVHVSPIYISLLTNLQVFL